MQVKLRSMFLDAIYDYVPCIRIVFLNEFLQQYIYIILSKNFQKSILLFVLKILKRENYKQKCFGKYICKNVNEVVLQKKSGFPKLLTV